MLSSAFPQSAFVPVALGFFGLGTGYLVLGGWGLFGRTPPNTDPAAVRRSLGYWALAMPGFMQFITGIILFVGLTWFDVFESAPPLYMAALAFTAYGVHWFAMGTRMITGTSAAPDAYMAIAYIVLSVLGAVVFFAGGRDVPVAILFVFLAAIYLVEFPTKLGLIGEAVGGKLVAALQFTAGFWLMYLTCGVTLDLTIGAKWWT